MSSTTLRQRRKEPIKEQEASVFSRPETQQAFVSFRLALLITTGIVIATLLLAYMTSPITAVGVEELTIVELTGPFELNRKLSKGKQILMSAPESIVEHKGNLYTGLADGRIVKIHPSEDGALGAGKVEYLTNGIIPKAEKTTEDINHGRALGIRIHDNDLYVADAIYGLYKLDLNSKEITILVRPSDTNPPMKFPDDLDITADGKIVYFSDASYRCPITTLINEALEGTCTSRIFKYHVFTHKLETVMTGLCFGNGVQLTKDEKTLIIPETTRYRVSWVDTTTWKTKHVLKIPAMPDNVRMNRHGTYWVGATSKLSKPLQFLFRYPFLRQIVIGLVPANVILGIPNRKHNMLFEVNDNGEIIETLHDPDGDLTFAVAQGTELSDGRIALGTYAAPFLAIADRSE